MCRTSARTVEPSRASCATKPCALHAVRCAVQHWLAVQVRSNTASELVQRRNSRTDFEASDGRNVVELNIKRISLDRHAAGDANPTTFVMFDFFVHDTQTSELITGAHIGEPQWLR